MEYIDIIRENCKKHSSISWWPRYAFHYTDVTNVVSILSSHHLYSRADASQLKIMKNDNASRQVIDMTDSGIISKVRFYFRPLTPTQYYNEGYKHSALRYSYDENANVPVPIFLLFDLSKLLELAGVQFSETSQAGYGAELYSGIDAFEKLNFEYIYDNRYENFNLTRKYRHAEIVVPNSMDIDPYIENILCRNSLEQTTLLNLLKEKSPKAFVKYKDKIKQYKKDLFYYNGVFLTACEYHNNTVSISISDTYAKESYVKRMMEKNGFDVGVIEVGVLLSWYNSQNICKQEMIPMKLDICKNKILTITNLPEVLNATKISIKVYFEGALMGYVIQSLKSAELLK